jgi:hypothetical protein
MTTLNGHDDRLTLDDDAHRYGLLCALFEAAWHHDVPASLDELEAGPLMTSTEARRLSMLAVEVFDRFDRCVCCGCRPADCYCKCCCR